MDLGAFLRPGGSLSVTMAPAEDGGETVTGRLTERHGHPVWTCPSSQPPGRLLTLTVGLPGFRLADDGSLIQAEAETKTLVSLLGRVAGCRFFSAENQYVLRLKLLGRIDP